MKTNLIAAFAILCFLMSINNGTLLSQTRKIGVTIDDQCTTVCRAPEQTTIMVLIESGTEECQDYMFIQGVPTSTLFFLFS